MMEGSGNLTGDAPCLGLLSQYFWESLQNDDPNAAYAAGARGVESNPSMDTFSFELFDDVDQHSEGASPILLVNEGTLKATVESWRVCQLVPSIQCYRNMICGAAVGV
jgi:hypothetical protein